MKKILGLVLLLALFVPAAAQAKINLYGQFDVMGANWQGLNYSNFQNEYSFTNSRFLLGANFDVDENIQANVALKYARSWGQDYVAGQPVEDNITNDGVLNSIRIAEANIVFKNLFDNDRMSLKIGKFFYGEKGDSIFYLGLRDMSQIGYDYSLATNVYNTNYYESGMDGVWINYDTKENFKMDAVYSKLANENNTINTSKINMFILDAKYKVNDNIKVRGYLYDSETTGTSFIGYGNRGEFIGIKPEIKFENLAASVEFAQQFSSVKSQLFDETLDDATLVKINGSYLLDISKGMTLLPRIQYLRAGDDFSAAMSDANWGMASSTVWWWWSNALRSIESYNIGADLAVSKYQLSADFFQNSGADGGYPWYEIDLKAEYNYTEQVKFYAGYAYIVDVDDSSLYYNYTTAGVKYKF